LPRWTSLELVRFERTARHPVSSPTVQQRATPKVRDGAFWKQKRRGVESVIIALIDAALMRVFVVVTQSDRWIRKPSVAGSIPAIGSTPYN
jgi:hypothetical protein